MLDNTFLLQMYTL